jgi:hypothetical protein
MTRNVDVIEEKMDLVTNLNYYFYLNGENVAKKKFKTYAIFLPSNLLKFNLQTRFKV